MKASWAVESLGEISDFQGGSQPPKSNFVDQPREGYVRLLQIRDFKSDKWAVYVPIAKSNKLCQENDIMIGRYGASVGQIHRGKAGAYNVALIRTIPNLDLIDREFFYHYLNSDLFQKPLFSVADRSAQAGFSKDDIAPFLIPLPPLDEQRRIVAVLEKAFTGIATAIANAQKNLANARALFESALQRELENSETSSSSTTIGSEVDFCFGFAFKSNRYTSDLCGVRLLRGDNIINGSLRWDGVVRWPADEQDEYRAFELQSGDVVLAMDRTWVKSGLKFAVINESDLPLLQVQRVARMRCRATLLHKFLAYQIESPAFTKYIVSIQTGLGVPHISGKQIGAFNFIMPSLDNQKQIVTRLDAMKALQHKLVASYQTKLAALTELKQSLLQKAFAGELT